MPADARSASASAAADHVDERRVHGDRIADLATRDHRTDGVCKTRNGGPRPVVPGGGDGEAITPTRRRPLLAAARARPREEADCLGRHGERAEVTRNAARTRPVAGVEPSYPPLLAETAGTHRVPSRPCTARRRSGGSTRSWPPLWRQRS